MRNVLSSYTGGGASERISEHESVKSSATLGVENIDIADIVKSINGRDEGKYFLVIGTEDEYSLIADGKSRRVEKPKRKKNKHLKLEDKSDVQIAAKLIGGEKITNNEIRRTLAGYAADRGEKGGMQ